MALGKSCVYLLRIQCYSFWTEVDSSTANQRISSESFVNINLFLIDSRVHKIIYQLKLNESLRQDRK